MERVKIFIIAAVFLFVGLSAFVLINGLAGDKSNDDPVTNSAESNEPLSGDVAVEVKSSTYTPNRITVKKGTTVTWTNQDSIEHNIAPDDVSSGFAGSELLGRGESYSFTFEETGTFNYHCTPHPFMTGVVEVVE